MNNQKQIATGILMYAQDHDEMLPTAESIWGAIGMDKGVLKCPTKSRLVNGYVFNGEMSGIALGEIGTPTDTPLIADGLTRTAAYRYGGTAALYPNVAYGPDEVETTRHGGKAIGAFCDGHVEFLTTSPELNGFGPPTPYVVPTGSSAALTIKSITATIPTGGSLDVGGHPMTNMTDSDQFGTYWEANTANGSYPATVTISLPEMYYIDSMVFSIPWTGGRSEDIAFASTIDGANYTNVLARATYSYDSTTKLFTINASTTGFGSGIFARKIRMVWYKSNIGGNNVQCSDFKANGR